MMNREQIAKWVNDHINMKSKLIFNEIGYAMYKFENGDTYEYSNKPYNGEHSFMEEITITINNKIVSHYVIENTWLDNGNFGSKFIKELPIENVA